MVAEGSRKITAARMPGEEKGFRDEKAANTMAMHEPAPATAASDEAANISFRRIVGLQL